MNYSEIDVEDEVARVVSGVEGGDYRVATERESMSVRLAALSEIVREMQVVVNKDMRLVDV